MQIREYRPGDEQQILEMDWLLFPDPWNKRNLENWYWKYAGNNPAGKSIIYVMENEGKIIVHFAIVPYRLRVFGKDTFGSHSIGSMVLPEWQGKGLIKFVADKLFAEAEKRKILFSYGFPNDLAYELHKKMFAYDDVVQVYTMEKKTDANIPGESSDKFSFLPIDKFDQSVDMLWQLSKDTYKISVVRDAAFLNWRYLERPDQKYYAFGAYEDKKLVGYVILKLYKDDKILKGHIIDIFSLPKRKDVAEFLVVGSERFLVKNKTDIESAWVVGSDFYESILEEKGFKPQRPRPLICRLNFEKDSYQEILNGKNWYFTMGDTTEIY